MIGRTIVGTPSGWWASAGKRAADVVLVLASACLWLPLLVAVAGLVWIASGRPIFFIQERIGRDAHPFGMLKIRTMHPDVGAPAGATLVSWTYCGDPRITTIGRWLRRWRLDEIPQFLNVLNGSMSLVGPRPETREATEYLQARIPNYRRRLVVRPGVTGLCQVSSEYLHFTTLDEISQKVGLDLRYVEAVSARTDAYILLRTILILLRGQGIS